MRKASFSSGHAPARTCLAFFLIICLAWAALLSPVYAASSPAERYETAKQEMDRLQGDARRRAWREPWQKLAAEFLAVYEKGAGWNNRPAALYRSALALEEMARRSRLASDAREALRRYDRLVREQPSSVLADDALLNSARIQAELLGQPEAARTLLQKIRTDYASGDMFQEAERYERTLPGGSQSTPDEKNTAHAAPEKPEAKTAPSASPGRDKQKQAILRQVAWQSRRDRVTITLEFNRPVAWTVRSQPANPKTGSPIRLFADLSDTMPDPEIRPGVKISDSMLTRMRLDLSSPGHTRMLLDFSEAKAFSVSTAAAPFRLIITVARAEGIVKNGLALGRFVQSEEPVKPASDMLPANLAQQLGLSVRSVMVDAGHGGKDPGTSHNGILEREVTLDLAKRVGALLAGRGLKVYYTRDSDMWVPLEDRSRKANELKADLFISIHVNASPNTNASGFETYYLNFASGSEAAKLAGVENALSERKLGEMEGLLADLVLGARTQESRRLARNIQNTSLGRLKKKGYTVKNGGIKSAPFHVLLGSGMPGALIEVGYCTNKREAKRLATKEYRAALADGIASGILAYAGKLAR